MGNSAPKAWNKNDPLLLCKARTRYMQQTIDSRNALSATHLSYIQSLCNMGTALRRFVEVEVQTGSLVLTSESEDTPSRSSLASPSPFHIANIVGSPSSSAGGSPPTSLSHMRAPEDTASQTLLKGIDPSWDFFCPTEFKDGENSSDPSLGSPTHLRQSNEAESTPLIKVKEGMQQFEKNEITVGLVGNVEHWSYFVQNNISGRMEEVNLYSTEGTGLDRDANFTQILSGEDKGRRSKCSRVSESVKALVRIASGELYRLHGENAGLEKGLCAEREDVNEFITHRAKDFLSSMKDIELQFLKAAECGNEVSRMLETIKIDLAIYSETMGKSPCWIFLSAFSRVYCKWESKLEHELAQQMTTLFSWNRPILFRSLSSKHPLERAPKGDVSDGGSDFTQDYFMISGSHSATLDRLYAWERKLYDEVKVIKSLKQAYDKKCSLLRNQVSRDLDSQVTDKTRAAVKDLHSQLRVAIQAVGSISKRIEDLRDDEFQPQLVELMQGLIRMWRTMIECHHSQYITISLAYSAKGFTAPPRSESYMEALTHLRNEVSFFGSSLTNWVNAHISFMEALSTWLQIFISEPQERSRGRNVVFPTRRACLPLPPAFTLCRDWLAGIKSLPSEELCDSIRGLVAVLQKYIEQHTEEKQMQIRLNLGDGMNLKHELSDKEERCTRDSILDSLQSGLGRVFDQLIKFSEFSLKTFEDVNQRHEKAWIAYASGDIRL